MNQSIVSSYLRVHVRVNIELFMKVRILTNQILSLVRTVPNLYANDIKRNKERIRQRYIKHGKLTENKKFLKIGQSWKTLIYLNASACVRVSKHIGECCYYSIAKFVSREACSKVLADMQYLFHSDCTIDITNPGNPRLWAQPSSLPLWCTMPSLRHHPCNRVWAALMVVKYPSSGIVMSIEFLLQLHF